MMHSIHMYLTGLLHRDRLFDVADRWFADRVEPDDGPTVTEIFVFERVLTAPVVRALLADLAHAMGVGALRLERVSRKDAVRDAIVAVATDPTARMRELIAGYHARPEEFFPRTPVNMSLASRADGRLVAMVRRKRLRRIADKVSRRLADHLADAISDAARELATARARDAGLTLGDLVSAPETMREEFAAAERMIAERFRTGELRLDAQRLRVDDVIGLKMIGKPSEMERVEAMLERRDDTTIVEREVHDREYRAVHLLLEVAMPPARSTLDRLSGIDWAFAGGRGLSPSDLCRRLPAFVASAARSFRIEVILTSFADLFESELGRTIHEARILDQRSMMAYSGRIAQNASYLIEYLLRLAISPTVEVSELPVRMWGRYLRDTISHAIAELDGGDRNEWLLPPSESGRVLSL